MRNDGICLILDNIRSRENVGSIFRTADGAGVAKIYLCGITPTPQVGNPKLEILNPKQIQNSKLQILNPDKIAKTALGAEKWVPWEYRKETWRLIEQLKKGGMYIVALEKCKKAQNIFDIKVKSPQVLVVGNEVRGLSPRILRRANQVAAIPMYGRKESLNVAVAVGVAAYALLQR